MITSLEFLNFRMLREASLPLGRLTLLLGPNGSGKSTALHALTALRTPDKFSCESLISFGVARAPDAFVAVGLGTSDTGPSQRLWTVWGGPHGVEQYVGTEPTVNRRPWRIGGAGYSFDKDSLGVFAFEPSAVAAPVQLTQTLQFGSNGKGMAAALTTLQDQFPERFDALNADLGRWLPDFDRILFETPSPGTRGFMLRLKDGKYPVPASNLSHGTLFTVALLALVHQPSPPALVGLEEPDRGLHPRLLRDVLGAIRRLTHPEEFDDARPPVQVIITTHSPYLVDHFRDHAEDIVLAEKQGNYAVFKRLADQPHISEIIDGAQLGEVWYSGILGGVPVGQ